MKTRDTAAVEESARIWAEATAKRDESEASDVAVSEAAPLIHDLLEASDRSFLLTLSEDDGMLSFAAVEPQRDADDPKKAELRYLGVAPGHWGEGWARRLLVALPDAMREEGFDEAVLWVYADNTRAIFVYESMAWSATPEQRRHERTNRVEQQYRIKL
ncbi:GNAT family N-acetyltransferase [Mariniluteicoccus flavus]